MMQICAQTRATCFLDQKKTFGGFLLTVNKSSWHDTGGQEEKRLFSLQLSSPKERVVGTPNRCVDARILPLYFLAFSSFGIRQLMQINRHTLPE
jgi:hypothetical protein